MLGLRGPVVAALLGKEAREVLRDRRTLLLTLVVPALVYPLFIAGMGQVTVAAVASLKGRPVDVAVAPEVPTDVTQALRRAEAVTVRVTEEPVRAVEQGEAQAGVSLGADAGPDSLQLILDGAKDESRAAADRVEKALEAARADRLKARLAKLGVDQAYIQPLPIQRHNTSTPQRMKSYGAARILPFLLIVLSLMGATAAAVDTTAGERERSTLLTLLSTPVRAGEVAAAKLVMVAAVALAAGLVNLAALALTLSSGLSGSSEMSLSLDPWLLAGCVLALLPTTLYGAALLLGLAALGRTTREAQTTTAPALFIGLGMSAVVAIPGVQASLMLNVLPVTGPALLMRDLLMGDASGEQVLTVVVASVVTLWLVVSFAARVLTSEPMVSNQVSTVAVIRDLTGARQPTPLTAATLSALLLANSVYLVPWLVGRDLAWGLLTTQLTLAGLAVGLLMVLRLDVRPLMGLAHLPPGRAVAAGLLFGLSLLLPIALAQAWLVRVTGMDKVMEQAGQQLQELLTTDLSPWQAVLLVGLVPGIFEELAFRGALQGVLMRVTAGRWAVVIQAAVFGLAHGSPIRFLPTFLLGLVLGWLRKKSGSVLPGIVLHAVHNGLLALAMGVIPSSAHQEDLQELVVPLLQPVPWLVALCALVVATWMTWRCQERHGSGGEASAGGRT